MRDRKKPANFYISKRNPNTHRRRVLIFFPLALIVALIGYSSLHKPPAVQPPAPPPEAKTKKAEASSIEQPRVVLLSTLSGLLAKDGEMLRRGAEMAWEELTKQGLQGDFIAVDGAREQSELIGAVSQLAADPQVLLVIGRLPMDTLSEIVPIFEKNQLPLIVLSDSHEGLVNRPWVFPLFCSETTEGAFAATAALKWSEDKTPVVIYEPGPYGDLLMQGFREQAGKSNLSYSELASLPDDPSLDAALSSVIDMDNTPAVWLAGSPSWGNRVADMLHGKGYKGRLLVPQCYEEKLLGDLKGKFDERLYVLRPVLIADSSESTIQAFSQSFRERFWWEPNWLALSAYDVFQWIGKGMQTPPLSRKKIRDYLMGHNSPERAYHGLGGPVFFAVSGER